MIKKIMVVIAGVSIAFSCYGAERKRTREPIILGDYVYDAATGERRERDPVADQAAADRRAAAAQREKERRRSQVRSVLYQERQPGMVKVYKATGGIAGYQYPQNRPQLQHMQPQRIAAPAQRPATAVAQPQAAAAPIATIGAAARREQAPVTRESAQAGAWRAFDAALGLPQLAAPAGQPAAAAPVVPRFALAYSGNLVLAKRLFDAENYDQASRLYNMLAAQNKNLSAKVGAQIGLGRIAFRQNRLDDAVRFFQQVIESPHELNDYDARLFLMRTYEKQNKQEQARQLQQELQALTQEQKDRLLKNLQKYFSESDVDYFAQKIVVEGEQPPSVPAAAPAEQPAAAEPAEAEDVAPGKRPRLPEYLPPKKRKDWRE